MENQLPERQEPTFEGLLAKWAPDEIANGFQYLTSLPNQTDDERLAVLRLIEGECAEGGSLIGSQFYLSDYVAHPVQITNEETGEIVDAIRCLLPQPEGPPIKFVSVGVLKSIGRICSALRRAPPFDPPLLVKLVQQAVKGGKRTFKLQVVRD